MVMKIAVPCTRAGGNASSCVMNSRKGCRSRACMSANRRRPRRHVIMSVNTTTPTSKGSQPPSWILKILAPNSRMSITSSAPSSTIHSTRLPPVESRGNTANASTEVVSMVPVTAKP
ncbi:Uncharacterised protein [Bordetella pertussis]|nr:Uncharacterised protein [Bordetella pertussis]